MIELMPQPRSTSILDINLEADDQELQTAEHGQEFSLPEADGGKEAWLFLAGCFMVEAIVWGALSFAGQTWPFFSVRKTVLRRLRITTKANYDCI